MGADKKKVESLMGEVFGENVVKAELSMEEAGKLTQAVLCKAIDPETSDEDAQEIIKRGRALVSAIAEQDGTVKKADGDDGEEMTVYLIEKALVDALIEDTKGVEVKGSWGSNMDALRKRFEASSDDSESSDEDGESEGDAEGDGDGESEDDTDDKGERKSTKKKAGDEDSDEDDDEAAVWGRTYDLNSTPSEDEDWGKDPDSIRG